VKLRGKIEERPAKRSVKGAELRLGGKGNDEELEGTRKTEISKEALISKD